jgi:hypothetical protein
MNSASVHCIPVIVKLVAFVFILHSSLIVGRAAVLNSEPKQKKSNQKTCRLEAKWCKKTYFEAKQKMWCEIKQIFFSLESKKVFFRFASLWKQRKFKWKNNLIRTKQKETQNESDFFTWAHQQEAKRIPLRFILLRRNFFYILETSSPYLLVSPYEAAILKTGSTKMTSLVIFATEIEREHNSLSSLMMCFFRVIPRRRLVFLFRKNCTSEAISIKPSWNVCLQSYCFSEHVSCLVDYPPSPLGANNLPPAVYPLTYRKTCSLVFAFSLLLVKKIKISNLLFLICKLFFSVSVDPFRNKSIKRMHNWYRNRIKYVCVGLGKLTCKTHICIYNNIHS